MAVAPDDDPSPDSDGRADGDHSPPDDLFWPLRY